MVASMAPASSVYPLLSVEKAVGLDKQGSVLVVPDLPLCPWERDPKKGTLQKGGEAQQPLVPWVSLHVLKDGLNMWKAVLLTNIFIKNMRAVAVCVKPEVPCSISSHFDGDGGFV